MRKRTDPKVRDAFTEAELRTILHYMAIALRHGRGAFRPVEKYCCREHEEWIPVLRKVERFLGIESTAVTRNIEGGKHQ